MLFSRGIIISLLKIQAILLSIIGGEPDAKNTLFFVEKMVCVMYTIYENVMKNGNNESGIQTELEIIQQVIKYRIY